jgi:hypothetical protein
MFRSSDPLALITRCKILSTMEFILIIGLPKLHNISHRVLLGHKILIIRTRWLPAKDLLHLLLLLNIVQRIWDNLQLRFLLRLGSLCLLEWDSKVLLMDHRCQHRLRDRQILREVILNLNQGMLMDKRVIEPKL